MNFPEKWVNLRIRGFCKSLGEFKLATEKLFSLRVLKSGLTLKKKNEWLHRTGFGLLYPVYIFLREGDMPGTSWHSIVAALDYSVRWFWCFYIRLYDSFSISLSKFVLLYRSFIGLMENMYLLTAALSTKACSSLRLVRDEETMLATICQSVP